MRDRAIVAAYGLAVITFALLALVVLRHFARFGDQANWVHHTHEVLRLLEQSLGELRDVETGQRGYLIAGDEQFLEPYQAAAALTSQSLDVLRSLTTDNPAQQRHLEELRWLIDQKLTFTAETIAVFEGGDQDGAYEMVRSRQGKLLMDQIRRRVAEMAAAERRLLEARSQAAEATAWQTNVLLVTGNALGFAFLATGTLLLGRELNRRRRIDQDRSFAGERQRLQAAAQLAHRRLETVVAELPAGVVLVDLSGAVILDNITMRNAYGGVLATAQGGWQSTFARADGTPYGAGEHPLTRSLAGDAIRGEELQLVRADATSCRVIANTAPVREQDGRVVAAVGVFLDASEVEREEERRAELDRFRDVFLAALGHDLRNPLSVITAGAASLGRHAASATEGKIAARMSSSADRMARMIGQLLDLVQARLGGGIPLHPQRIDLRDITRTAVELLEVRHPDRTLAVESEGELVGEWDAARIADVIHAVVVNALEHGRPDAPVQVTIRQRGGDAQIEVHNWGNPIPQELVPLIFDPFRRATERRRMKSVGLGLGLYLALQIVRGHGGTIDVESSAEMGTVFRVRLPRDHE
jgi:signal transduction histidine kinase